MVTNEAATVRCALEHLERYEIDREVRRHHAVFKAHQEAERDVSYFRELDGSQLPRSWVDLAVKAADVCSLLLGIDRPGIRWFEKARSVTEASFVSTRPALLGQVREGTHEVWLSPFQPARSLLETVAHESKHLTQSWPATEDHETEAYSYGRNIGPVLAQIIGVH